MNLNCSICRPIKNGHFFSLILCLCVIFKGCSATYTTLPDVDLISIDNLRANLEFLASDELEGREAASRGEKLAALFIASELKKYGIKPFYPDYLQEYGVHCVSVDSSSYIVITDIEGNKIRLNYPDDFFADRRNSESGKGNYGLVFAGYGITAPEFNYDDYADLDINGKIVVICDGEPSGADSVYFNGEKKSEYSDDSFKISLAREKGAAGIITIPSASYFTNWDRLRRYASRKYYSLASDEKKIKLLKLTFNEKAVSELFKGESFTFDNIKDLINNKKPLPKFELSRKIEINVTVTDTVRKSYNVVGLIEGTDPDKKNEFIAAGAHYDHVGIIDGKVYNGADDNGSGVVAVLETARALAETNANERSVLVVFHGAEEKGLLGSKYFTSNFHNMDNIIAHINMDMVGREHIDTIYSVGSGKISSEFKSLIESVNKKTVNFVFNYGFDNPDDKERIYYRSDHYNYAKYGVPVVFFYDYMLADYHKHTDETGKINFEKIRKTATLVYNIIITAARLTDRLRPDNEEYIRASN